MLYPRREHTETLLSGDRGTLMVGGAVMPCEPQRSSAS
jgi:hypothetical protein